jgi:hypothetical protein
VPCGVWQKKIVVDVGNQLNFNRKLTMWTIFVENIFFKKIDERINIIFLHTRGLFHVKGKNAILYNLCGLLLLL